MLKAAVIDYGSGNLRSVAKAFERAAFDAGIGCKVNITSQAGDLKAATHVVLPGVGAFADCKKGLQSLPGMLEALEQAVISQAKPFLGVCVGMQLMARTGFEHGKCQGLGWIDAEVRPIETSDSTLKIPHMGWNELIISSKHPLFDGIVPGAHVYFVHSYAVFLKDKSDCLAEANYGCVINAAIGRGNMIGVQFHPEKSQQTGLNMIANFLRWRP